MNYIWLILISFSLSTSLMAAPIAISSSIDLDTYLNVRTVNVSDTDADYVTQGSTINPLSANVSANITNPDYTLSSSGSINSTWLDTSSGFVEFDLFVDVNSPTYPTDANFRNSKGWEYTFRADTNSILNLSYSNISSGFGTNDYVFSFNGSTSIINDNRTGSVTPIDLVAGQIYTFGIGWDGCVTRCGPNINYVFDHTFSQSATFNWQIESAVVPVPGALWLLLSGTIALLSIARRNR